MQQPQQAPVSLDRSRGQWRSRSRSLRLGHSCRWLAGGPAGPAETQSPDLLHNTYMYTYVCKYMYMYMQYSVTEHNIDSGTSHQSLQ